ncbi:MAG: DUF4835 family protein [Bacteroidia bacterium]|nr:DUF4835 family protein [Bacteroidia bacterium]
MAEKAPEGRTSIAEGLEGLKKVWSNKPGNFLMQLFFTAKADEIVNIFSEAYPDEKARMVNLLSQIDPANSSKYQKINTMGSSGIGSIGGGSNSGGGNFMPGGNTGTGGK